MNLWQQTTYTTGLDILTQIDTWLVNTMNYTRNLTPTSDAVTVTGYKSHYQYTFPSGETGYLTFKTDTAANKIYVNSSNGYASTSAWNNQPEQTRSVSGSSITPSISFVPSASKMLYMFGDLKGNIQIFVQKGTRFDSTSLIQFGVLDKTGFGQWTGGVYISCFDLGTESNEVTITNASPTLIANADNTYGATYRPRMLVDIVYKGKKIWAGVYRHNIGSQSSGEYPTIASISASSSYYNNNTELILFPDVCVNYSSTGSSLPSYRLTSYNYTDHPNRNSFTSMQDMSGYVCSMTGRIFMYSPIIHIRHESTGRISVIGRMPFGFHCPVASVSSLDAITPGTEIVQNGRTFVLMGNIAAEKVVR
jgi:hypothetical protein